MQAVFPSRHVFVISTLSLRSSYLPPFADYGGSLLPPQRLLFFARPSLTLQYLNVSPFPHPHRLLDANSRAKQTWLKKQANSCWLMRRSQSLVSYTCPSMLNTVRFLQASDYSDLDITCGEHTFHVHKVIVCTRSHFFSNAIKFPGKVFSTYPPTLSAAA